MSNKNKEVVIISRYMGMLVFMQVFINIFIFSHLFTIVAVSTAQAQSLNDFKSACNMTKGKLLNSIIDNNPKKYNQRCALPTIPQEFTKTGQRNLNYFKEIADYNMKMSLGQMTQSMAIPELDNKVDEFMKKDFLKITQKIKDYFIFESSNKNSVTQKRLSNYTNDLYKKIDDKIKNIKNFCANMTQLKNKDSIENLKIAYNIYFSQTANDPTIKFIASEAYLTADLNVFEDFSNKSIFPSFESCIDEKYGTTAPAFGQTTGSKVKVANAMQFWPSKHSLDVAAWNIEHFKDSKQDIKDSLQEKINKIQDIEKAYSSKNSQGQARAQQALQSLIGEIAESSPLLFNKLLGPSNHQSDSPVFVKTDKMNQLIFLNYCKANEKNIDQKAFQDKIKKGLGIALIAGSVVASAGTLGPAAAIAISALDTIYTAYGVTSAVTENLNKIKSYKEAQYLNDLSFADAQIKKNKAIKSTAFELLFAALPSVVDQLKLGKSVAVYAQQSNNLAKASSSTMALTLKIAKKESQEYFVDLTKETLMN